MLSYGGIEPKCACGCGSPVKFHTVQIGFSEYAWGHASRVKNNWGHNKEAQQKSQDIRREMYKRGEIEIWNKGKTKETDERVAEVGRTQSENFTPERRAKRAEIMSNSWQSGAIVPLTGPAHSQWKGGTSALQPICRARLHSCWTYPKLKASGFKCSKCNAPGPELNVHHCDEHFAPILFQAIRALGEPGDDFEKKSAIADWVAFYHVEHDVPGIVLCHDCHVTLHDELGEHIN